MTGSDPVASDDAPDPASGSDRAPGSPSWRRRSLRLLLLLFIVYVAGFALVVVDTIYLDERIWQLLPEASRPAAQELLQTIYAPIILLIRLCTG